MDALLNGEEALLEETVVALLDKSVPGSVKDLLELDDRRLWRLVADADLLGLGVPADLGGIGTFVDVAIVAEAFGRALAPAPFLGSTVLAMQLLVCAGSTAEALAPLVAGERRLAVALDPGLQHLADVTDAEAVAWDAGGAAAALARHGDEIVLVQLGDRLQGFDQTRCLRAVHLDASADMEPPGGRVSPQALEAWSARAWTGLAADAVGVMDGALQAAVEHVKAREQFGVPIGSFQAVQHLLAESRTSLEGARSVTRFAAWALEHRDAAESVRAAHTAKAYCAEAARTVCEAAIQVHGGMGMTWDCSAHLYLRRAMADRHVLGDELAHLHALTA